MRRRQTNAAERVQPRSRNARRRGRPQDTKRAGDPRVALVTQDLAVLHGATTDGLRGARAFPVGPVGRFSRAVRRMDNYVARGEWLERELGRAETPSQREGIQRQLLVQINKVAAFADRLERR